MIAFFLLCWLGLVKELNGQATKLSYNTEWTDSESVIWTPNNVFSYDNIYGIGYLRGWFGNETDQVYHVFEIPSYENTTLNNIRVRVEWDLFFLCNVEESRDYSELNISLAYGQVKNYTVSPASWQMRFNNNTGNPYRQQCSVYVDKVQSQYLYTGFFTTYFSYPKSDLLTLSNLEMRVSFVSHVSHPNTEEAWAFQNLNILLENEDTFTPTKSPTHRPSKLPTDLPSATPSKYPSLIPSVVPSNNPSVYPSYEPTAPTQVPTMSNIYRNEYITNWKDWEGDMAEFIPDYEKLSIYIPYGDNECWNMIYDQKKANNQWLMGYRTEYRFRRRYEIEWFNAKMNMNFARDSEWGIETTNPVFAIGNRRSFVALCLLDNGTLIASGNDGINSNLEFGNVTDVDTFDIPFRRVLNGNGNGHELLYGFENGFGYPIEFGVKMDRSKNITTMVVKYYNENGTLLRFDCEYNDLFGDSNSNIIFYVGAMPYDDYYRFREITFEYGTNGYEIGDWGREHLINHGSNYSTDLSGWINGGKDLTFLTSNQSSSWIHGWYNDSDYPKLIIDELPYITSFEFEMDLYIRGLNETLVFSGGNYNYFEIIVIAQGGNNGEQVTNTLIYQSAETPNCQFNNESVTSYWERAYDEYSNLVVCVLHIEESIFALNFTFISNFSVEIRYINQIENGNYVPLTWGCGDLVYNSSDDGFTDAPTPSPTTDHHYFDGIVKRFNTSHVHLQPYRNFLFEIDTGITIPNTNDSYLQITLGMNDEYNESSTDIILLLADKRKFTGIYFEDDTIEFTGEPGSDSFVLFSNGNWTNPVNDLTWYPSTSAWEAKYFKFKDTRNITINYYSNPFIPVTYVSTEKEFMEVNTISFESQWYELYHKRQELTIFIALIDNNKLANNESDFYINDSSLIDFVECKFMTDDKEKFTPTAFPTQVPTFAEKYETQQVTNWQDWEQQMPHFIGDYEKLSIYIPYGDNECWNMVYDDHIAQNYWLLGYETDYAFYSENNHEFFGASSNMDFHQDPQWGIENANPVFAIGDGHIYIGLCILNNGTMLASGRPGIENSTFEHGRINETDTTNIYFGQMLNQPDDNRTHFGFENGFGYPIDISIHCDRDLNVTRMVIEYYNPMFENQTVSCIYNGVFHHDGEHLQFFVGSMPGDDYYRFDEIIFYYGTNDYDIAEYGAEYIYYNNDTQMYESSLDWINGGKTDIEMFNYSFVGSNETYDTWIHGWFDSHDHPHLLLDDLPYVTVYQYNTYLYIDGLPRENNSLLFDNRSATGCDNFIVTAHGHDAMGDPFTFDLIVPIPINNNCTFHHDHAHWPNYNINSTWERIYHDELERYLCRRHIFGNVDLNGTYFRNMTLEFRLNETHTNENTTLDWGCGQIIYNGSDEVETSMPTPSPTRDANYIRYNDIVYDSNDLIHYHSNLDHYLYEIETNYMVSNPNNSRLEISMTMDDRFNESRYNVVILIGDVNQFTGICMQPDTVVYTGEPDSNDFVPFSNGWQDPVNDIEWYPSGMYWDPQELTFLNENRTYNFEYYFNPNQDLTYVHINGTFIIHTINYECQWHDIYNYNDTLTIYITLIDYQTGNVSKNDTSLITSVTVQFFTDDSSLYTTAAPVVAPTAVPTAPTLSPTDMPTFSARNTHEYHTYWQEWIDNNEEYINDTDKLSIYVPHGGSGNEIWIQVFFEYLAYTHWLIGIETEYSFNSMYDEEWFNAQIDCDLSTDESWGIINVNPVFAIGDHEQFVAIKIYENGTIFASSDLLNGVITHVDTNEIEFGILLNNPSNSDTLYGFDNGFNYPIDCGVSVDRSNNETTLVVDYYNNNGDPVRVSCVYQGVFSGDSDHNIVFFIGASIDDDYYRLEEIIFEYSSNSYDVSESGVETLIVLSDGNYTTDLDWGNNDLTFLDANDSDTWLHGWFHHHDHDCQLNLADLPYMTQFEYEMTIFVHGWPVNESLTFVNDTNGMNTIIITIVVNHHHHIEHTYEIPISDSCEYKNSSETSHWQPHHYPNGLIVCSCSIENLIDMNGSYINNISLSIEMNEMQNDQNVSLEWGFCHFMYNSSEDVETTAPTPSPTTDSHYNDGTIITVDFDTLHDEYETGNGNNYLFSVPCCQISDTNNSFVKITLGMNEAFDENNTDIILLFGDPNEYSGLYLVGDTVAFTSEPDSDSFNQDEISNDPMNDVEWFSSSHYWDSDGLTFLTDNDTIKVEYYFNPNRPLSYVHLNGTFMDVHTINFECQWNDIFASNETLTLYIALIDNGSYSNDTSLIDYVIFELLTDDNNLIDHNDPTQFPSLEPSPSPTQIPTFSNAFVSDYETNWQDWQDDTETFLNDSDKLSIYIPNGDDEYWVSIYDEDEADNHWLLVYESEYSFSNAYSNEWFNAEIDCDFSTDESWGIVNINPILAISDTESFVAIWLNSNGSIYASGSSGNGNGTSELEDGAPTSMDTMDINFGVLLNNPSNENTLYGFGNGFDYPINFGVKIDRESNNTAIILSYYNPYGVEITTSYVYHDVFSGTHSEHIHFYVGAVANDDYYKFESITFEYGTNDYGISGSGTESLIVVNNGTNATYESSLDWNDDNEITFLDENENVHDSWIHGWYDFDDSPTLILQNLPYINIFSCNIRVYVTGIPINGSLIFANDTTREDMFSLTIHGVTYDGDHLESVNNATIAQNAVCVYNNIRIRSWWRLTETNSSEIADNVVTCYYDIYGSLLSEDDSYFENLTISFNLIETHENDLTLQWAFGTFSYNLTEKTYTASPTPSPTQDISYSDSSEWFISHETLKENMTIDKNDNSSKVAGNYNYLFEIDSNLYISDVNNSYLKITLGMNNEIYNESRVSVLLLLGDDTQYSGVYLETDTVSFCGEPSTTNSFYNFSNDVWHEPHNEIIWYESDSHWQSNELTFLNDENTEEGNTSEIYYHYYFTPHLHSTHVAINGTFMDVNSIDFECQWYDYYDSNDSLTVYIALIEIDEESDEIRYIHNSSYINYVIFEFESDDSSLFEESERYGEVKLYNTADDRCNIGDNGGCFECLWKFESWKYNDFKYSYVFDNSTQTENCDCPRGNVTSNFTEMLTIYYENSKLVYSYSSETNNDAYSVETISGTIEEWMSTSFDNCSLAYYVNKGTFLNVSAENTIYFSFIMTVDHELSTTEIYLIKQLLKTFVSNVFNINKKYIVVKIEVIEDEEEVTNNRRRMLLADDDETSYQVDIIIIMDSYDDANDSISDYNSSIAAWLEDYLNGTLVSITNETLITVTEAEGTSIVTGSDASTSTGSSSSSSSDDGLATEWIVIIILCALCCFLCIFLIMYYRFKHRESYDKYEEALNTKPLTTDDYDTTDRRNESIEITGGVAKPLTETNDGDSSNGNGEIEIHGSPAIADGSDLHDENEAQTGLLQETKVKSKKKKPHGRQLSDYPIMVENIDPKERTLKTLTDHMKSADFEGGEHVTNDGNFTTTSTRTTSAGTSSVGSSITSKSKIGSLDATIIDYDDLDFGEELGKGQFGTVYKASWNLNTVAVKVLNNGVNSVLQEMYPNENDEKRNERWHVYYQTYKDEISKNNNDGNENEEESKTSELNMRMKELFSEVVLACKVPAGHHNLIRIYGYCPNPLCVVMPYMEYGSCQDFCYISNSEIDSKRKPSKYELGIILWRVASAVKFLHEFGLVHRDIAARNILLGKLNSSNRVDENTKIKLTDFGMTRELQNGKGTGADGDASDKTISNFGPLKWMAPESIKNHEYSTKSDAYMYGITIWEMYYGKEPYPRQDGVNVAIKVVNEDLRPIIDGNVAKEWRELMQMCWDADASQRPSFEKIHTKTAVLKDH